LQPAPKRNSPARASDQPAPLPKLAFRAASMKKIARRQSSSDWLIQILGFRPKKFEDRIKVNEALGFPYVPFANLNDAN